MLNIQAISGIADSPVVYRYPDEVREDVLALIPPDGRVIGSIGCGYATTEAILVERGRQVHGVDINPRAVEVARTRLTTARLVQPDDRQFFEPRSLDGLILADVIEHLPEAWTALRSFAGFVREGGWVVISVPNMRNFHVFKRFIHGGDWPECLFGVFDSTHLQVMSRTRLERWCAHADLRPEQWRDRWLPTATYLGYLLQRALDRLTLGCLHEWFMWQIQVCCRKTSQGLGPIVLSSKL